LSSLVDVPPISELLGEIEIRTIKCLDYNIIFISICHIPVHPHAVHYEIGAKYRNTSEVGISLCRGHFAERNSISETIRQLGKRNDGLTVGDVSRLPN